jgi:hypothetical protein
MQNGSAPGRSVPIQLVCKGADPLRQTNAGKNGAFYLKVERDDFNRVARSLSATTMDAGDGGLAGACGIQASLAGYESNTITVGKLVRLGAAGEIAVEQAFEIGATGHGFRLQCLGY